MNQELIGIKLDAPGQKFSRQIKIVLPKNYIQSIDHIADELNIKRRYIIWDAIGNYLRICKRMPH